MITPTLTSTLHEGNVACSGQTVVFTCRTSGSLEWRSDEYIGKGPGGRRLTFGIGDRVGPRYTVSNTTYAELANVSAPNITSKFYIMASMSSAVTCTATQHSQSSTIYLKILGKFLNVPSIVFYTSSSY